MRIQWARVLPGLALASVSASASAVQFPIDRENVYVMSPRSGFCKLGDFVIRSANGELTCESLYPAFEDEVTQWPLYEPMPPRPDSIYTQDVDGDLQRRQDWRNWNESVRQVQLRNGLIPIKIRSIVGAIAEDFGALWNLNRFGLDRATTQDYFTSEGRGLVEVEYSSSQETVIPQNKSGSTFSVSGRWHGIQQNKELSPKEEVRFDGSSVGFLLHVRKEATVKLTVAGIDRLQSAYRLRGTTVDGLSYQDFSGWREGDQVVGIVDEVDLGQMVEGRTSNELIGNATDDGTAVRFNDFALTHIGIQGYLRPVVSRAYYFPRLNAGREGRELRRELRRADNADEEAQVWIGRLDDAAIDSSMNDSVIRFRYSPLTAPDSPKPPVGN